MPGRSAARAGPGRGSSRRRGFWVTPEQGAEGLGEGGQGDVAVPSGVGASLEVVQAGLELAVVVLDPPADLRQPDEFSDVGVLGQVRQPVIRGLVRFGGPFGQQPAFRQAAVTGAGDAVAGRIWNLAQDVWAMSPPRSSCSGSPG